VAAPDCVAHMHWGLWEVLYALVAHLASFGVQSDLKLLEALVTSGGLSVYNPDRGGLWCSFPVSDLEQLQWLIKHCERTNLHIRWLIIKSDRVDKLKWSRLPFATEIMGTIQVAGLRLDLAEIRLVPEYSEILHVSWNAKEQKVSP
jgi:hypothetical protein